MAEALGLASGVIAVVDMATKVGGASIKLKRLWDEVKEAPYMLLQKAEQIRDFEEFLIDTECQVATNPLPAMAWNSALLQKYIVKARTASSELQEMIDDLLGQATAGRGYKRKIGSTKAVLRKVDIKALDARLDQALNLFKMAQGQYIIAIVTSTHITSCEGPSERCQNLESDKVDPVTYTPPSNPVRKKMVNISDHPISRELLGVFHERTILGKIRFGFGSDTGFQFILRTPDWLSASVYSILSTKSTLGWQVSLRAFEVVDNFDELEHYMEQDDTAGVFKFLAERKMSPFVRDRNGHSLLRWASYYTSTRLVDSLFDVGLGHSALEPTNKTNSDPWLYGMLLYGIPSFDPDSARQKTARAIVGIFAKHGFDEELMLSSQSFDDMTYSEIQIFRSLSGNQYYTYPIKQRLEIVRLSEICFVSDLFDMLPEAKRAPSDLLRKSRSPGTCSLIHSIASSVAWHLCTQPSDQLMSVTQHPWYEVASEYMNLDTEGLRHLESPSDSERILWNRQTPFATLLNSTLAG